tara:strand:- start:613 stop:1815 length:1203 start_codon:yes stop_codon:yes gene_type:complete
VFIVCISTIYAQAALTDGPLGKIELSVNTKATYDSNVFSMPTPQFNARKTASSELKSSDDLMLELTPAAHFTKKIKMIQLEGTLGARGVYFVRNKAKSYVNPITTLSVDFDESLTKRISNNAKIRFDAIFDLGQRTETSVLENDLTSYTYYLVGLNARYNHSPKFGVGASTSYTYRDYQSETGVNQYQDVTSMPVSARMFYIYSPKLDFLTEYTYTPTRGGNTSSARAIDAATHTINFGVQGDLFSKASGSVRIGHIIKNYDNDSLSESSVSLSTDLSWRINQKSSMTFNLGRKFEPSPQNNSILTASASVSLDHRLNEKMSASIFSSWSSSDYTTVNGLSGKLDSASRSMDLLTFGASLSKRLSQRFSANSGYTFSTATQSVGGDFDRHVLYVGLDGRY